jgi:PAS domain S-box-containing protein
MHPLPVGVYPLDVHGRRALDEPVARIEDPARDVGRFAELIDGLDAVVWEYQVGSGRYTYLSAAVERMLGYPPERWLEDPGFSVAVAHPDDRALVREFYERIERGGGHHRVEYRAIGADGLEVWTRDIVHVVDPGEGRPRLVRGLRLDITDRKRAESSLAETEARYRSLIEQIPAVTYIWAAAGAGSEQAGTYVSPQIEAILGYPPHEWLVDPDLWRSRVHPDDAARVLPEFDRCSRSGDPFDAEYRMVARDGRVVWLHDEAHIVAWEEDGSPSLWQGVMFDITERRRIEKERQTLLVRLVQAQEEERRRIGGEVHDDSVQKMAAVGIRIEALRKRVSDPEVVATVDDLHRSVRLSIARLRHLLFELRPPSLDRDGLATALREYLQQAGPDGGFSCAMQNGLHREPPIEVRTTAYRIAQEALANVRKHARASRVEVRLEQRDGGFITRIEDDGRGFDDPATDTGRPGHRGLATMRERAELAGGWLQIETTKRPAGDGEELATSGPIEPTTGTRVEFWLPFAEDGRGAFDVA